MVLFIMRQIQYDSPALVSNAIGRRNAQSERTNYTHSILEVLLKHLWKEAENFTRLDPGCKTWPQIRLSGFAIPLCPIECQLLCNQILMEMKLEVSAL